MNATYSFIRQNFKGLFKSLFWIAGPPTLLAGALFGELLNRMISTSQSPDFSPYNMEEYFTTVNFWLQLLGGLLFLLLAGVFTISVTYGYLLAYENKKEKDISVGMVWRFARKLFWRNVVNMIFYFIGLFISLILLLIPVGLLNYLFVSILPLFGVISILLFYVGIFFLFSYFSMIFMISNYERIDFFTAMGRLFFLARNSAWKTSGYILLNLYVQSVFSILFILPWYIYLFVVRLHSLDSGLYSKPDLMQEIIGNAFLMVNFLVSILLYAIPLVAMAFQYFNLIELREARGLMVELDSFGKEKSATQLHEDF